MSVLGILTGKLAPLNDRKILGIIIRVRFMRSTDLTLDMRMLSSLDREIFNKGLAAAYDKKKWLEMSPEDAQERLGIGEMRYPLEVQFSGDLSRVYDMKQEHAAQLLLLFRQIKGRPCTLEVARQDPLMAGMQREPLMEIRSSIMAVTESLRVFEDYVVFHTARVPRGLGSVGKVATLGLKMAGVLELKYDNDAFRITEIQRVVLKELFKGRSWALQFILWNQPDKKEVTRFNLPDCPHAWSLGKEQLPMAEQIRDYVERKIGMAP
ncbi:MAG: hypothetical protein IKK75_00250 [Clostridia bacterium]|nr:hypothetical protein [Clostridia bacterium]